MQVSRIIVRGIALLGLALAVTLGSLAAAPTFAGAQPDGYDGYDGYEGDDGYLGGDDCPTGYDGYEGYEGCETDTAPDDELSAPPATGGDGGGGTGGDTLPLTGGTTMLAAAVALGGIGIALRRFAATS